jgi:hypothetical protein
MLFAAMSAAEIILVVVAIGVVIDRVIAYFDRKQERARVAAEKKIEADEKEAERKRIKEEKELSEAREAARIERDRLAVIEARQAKAAVLEVKETLKTTTDAQAEKVEEVRAQATVAARGVDEVKVTLKETTEASTKQLTEIAKVGVETQKTTEAVHVLVNSAMSKALNVAAVALRRVATLTKESEDEKAARLAEAAYRDHEAKQRIVDQGEKLEPKP